VCDVHLIEELNETREATSRIQCCSCRRWIKKGERLQHVEGRLDDGSSGRWTYTAHEDCYWADRDEVHEDGCFTWTGAKKMTDEKTDVPTALLLRCTSESVAGKCRATIEVPFTAIHAIVPAVRNEDGSLRQPEPGDGLATYLFLHGKWLLSVLTKGRDPVVMGPVCPRCSKKVFKGPLLEEAHKRLQKLCG